MNCAWKELLAILPGKWKHQVDTYGREKALELRLRLHQKPLLERMGDAVNLEGVACEEDLRYVINMACRYSPWAAGSVRWGYLTAPGGHRIGLCGEVIIKEGCMTGFQSYSSLNIRIARDFPGISGRLSQNSGSMLIIGRPGSGKTTLLRDLLRQLSYKENVAVVDERGELFPVGFDRGERLDVLLGCGKSEGIDRVLRTMTPQSLAIDEITAKEDTTALMQAAWCGVRLLATAHAANIEDLRSREVYRPLMESRLFSAVVVLEADKSFHMERVEK